MEPQAVTGLVQYGALGIFCLALIAAVAGLWKALNRKEETHRAEREADRSAHLGALDRLATSTTSGMAELGRKLDRVEDLVARPTRAA